MGARSISALRAFVVRPLDMASRSFPTVIRVTMVAAPSKKNLSMKAFAASEPPTSWARDIAKSTARLYRYDTPAPRATRESMLGARFMIPRAPFTKNFWLMTSTTVVSASCNRAMATWFGSGSRNQRGKGKSNDMCPMLKYSRGSKNRSDQTSLFLSTGSSLSSSLSRPVSAEFFVPDAVRGSAP